MTKQSHIVCRIYSKFNETLGKILIVSKLLLNMLIEKPYALNLYFQAYFTYCYL